jgi:hypothetical protein
MDPRSPALGADLYGYCLCRDVSLPGERGRAKRHICYGRSRSNDFCRSGGDTVGVAGARPVAGWCFALITLAPNGISDHEIEGETSPRK